jgi:hypothetical protein
MDTSLYAIIVKYISIFAEFYLMKALRFSDVIPRRNFTMAARRSEVQDVMSDMPPPHPGHKRFIGTGGRG